MSTYKVLLLILDLELYTYQIILLILPFTGKQQANCIGDNYLQAKPVFVRGRISPEQRIHRYRRMQVIKYLSSMYRRKLLCDLSSRINLFSATKSANYPPTPLLLYRTEKTPDIFLIRAICEHPRLNISLLYINLF